MQVLGLSGHRNRLIESTRYRNIHECYHLCHLFSLDVNHRHGIPAFVRFIGIVPGIFVRAIPAARNNLGHGFAAGTSDQAIYIFSEFEFIRQAAATHNRYLAENRMSEVSLIR